jgi:DNA-binding NarL/FixJ family response regulator
VTPSEPDLLTALEVAVDAAAYWQPPGDEDILAAKEQAGATGDLLKDSPREELAAGVRSAARGETVLAPSIGCEMFITEATVKTHLLWVLIKLEVDDRTRAVTVALEQGLLPVP